jgi:hypothetical protein
MKLATINQKLLKCKICSAEIPIVKHDNFKLMNRNFFNNFLILKMYTHRPFAFTLHAKLNAIPSIIKKTGFVNQCVKKSEISSVLVEALCDVNFPQMNMNLVDL